jgi:hypothetical protein
MKNHFFLVFLIPPAILIASEASLLWPNFFYTSLIISIILIFLSVKAITREKIFSAKFLWLFFVPAFFLVSSTAYALIFPEKFFVHLIFFIQFLFLFYFLKNLSGKIKDAFLENVSYWGNFLSLFFCFSFLFGIKIFIGLSVVYSTLGFLLAILLVLYETFWANKIARSEALIFLFLIPLILIQLSWALYFLPLNHNVSGMILVIGYYSLVGMTKPLLRGSLSKRMIKFYLIGGLASIIMLLLTAKWI